MGCLIGMPKKRIIVENKLKTRKKTNKSPSQKNRTKQKRTELENFLKTEKHSPNWFKGKQIKLNPRPFSKPKKNLVNFHLDTVEKIDALLEDLEKETKQKNKEKTITSSRLVELRDPLRRKTMPPQEIEPDFSSEVINSSEDFFQTRPHRGLMPEFRFVKKLRESPDIVFIKKGIDEHIKEENFHTRMIGGKDVETQKHTTGFAHIKIRDKDEIPKNKEGKEKKTSLNEDTKTIINGGNNGVAKTKRALEETKKEIEEKKKELEQAKKEAKEREEELVKKMIEKEKKNKEDSKIKKLEMKKAKIETKEKERELKKKAKIEEKEKKLEAKMALKEEKLRQKMLEKKNKEKHTSKKDNKKEEEKPPALHRFVSGKKETIELNPLLDDDVRKVLIITDGLLEKLPEDVIDDFVKSKDFGLYEKVISKYKIK